jgi:hypothetical protein
MPKLRRKRRHGTSRDATALTPVVHTSDPDDMIDLFSVPPNKPATILWIKNVYLHPLSPLDENNPIQEFVMQPSSLEYAQLNRIRLKLKFKILKMNNAELTADESKKVTVTRLGLYGFFSDLKISVNGVIVESTNDHYIHQNQIHISTTKSEKEILTDLKLAGVLPCTNGMLDEVQLSNDDAFKQRQAEMASSKEVTWTGYLRTPLMMDSQRKLLPTNVSLRVTLTKANNEHIIIVGDDDVGKYKVKITDIQLVIPKVRLNDESSLAIEQNLHRDDAVYKFNRFQSSYITLAPGIQSTILETILTGNSPIATWVTMTNIDRHQGKENLNSLKYDDFKLRSMKVNLEEESDIRESLKVTATDVHEPILALYEGLNIMNHPYNFITITKDNFNKGLQMYLFSHTNSTVIEDYSDLQHLKRGNIKFQLDLRETHNKGIVIIFHMIFVSHMRITSDRRVLIDY